MKITPLDIQQQEFTKGLRGFSAKEVTDFLEKTAEAMTEIIEEKARAEEKIRDLSAQVAGYSEREESFRRAVVHSEKVLDQMLENARNEAKVIISEAELGAEKILASAHERLAELQTQISDLKRQRIALEMEIRAVLKAHERLLPSENDLKNAEDEEKIALFKKGS